VNAATFCRVFPFHIMFDRDLKIVQTGSTVARVVPKVTSPDCRVTDILDTVISRANTCSEATTIANNNAFAQTKTIHLGSRSRGY
jgi:hypothetical protein